MTLPCAPAWRLPTDRRRGAADASLVETSTPWAELAPLVTGLGGWVIAGVVVACLRRDAAVGWPVTIACGAGLGPLAVFLGRRDTARRRRPDLVVVHDDRRESS